MTNATTVTTTDPGPVKPPDFEAFYHSICADLQTKGEVHSMSKVFAHFHTDEERMRFILDKNFAGVLRFQEYNFDPKDRNESQRLRNQGNQVYQKNKLTEALEMYTQSICLAPHPPPPNSYVPELDIEGGFSYEELALGFANRSAVLFQMKEYDLCIRDITKAFDNSYPNNLMYKLFERKARCFRALKDFPRALECMKSAEMWMKYSSMSETKSSSFKKDVHKQIESLEEKVTQMAISEFSNTCEHKRSLVAPVKQIEVPKLPKELSKEVPCVRTDVKLQYAEDKGRFLVATEDIEPGKIEFHIFGFKTCAKKVFWKEDILEMAFAVINQVLFDSWIVFDAGHFN